MHDMQTTFRAGHLIRWQYRVINLLGQEASNAVYLVADEHTTHQKQFALKEVVHAVGEGQRDFPFDVAALKQLDHPALPRVYRVFHDDNHDRFSILMDYIEGNNLEAMRQLMPGKRFSLHTAMTLMSPIMDAVSYLHRQHPPLIHGDIKPSNIILPGAALASPSQLVDFGGGKNVYAEATARQHTFNFRAPEQYGRKTSRRTDVYALGAIFYTLLTGAVPAAASERLARGGAGEPDPLLPVDQFTPTDQIVASAICRALSISRLDRFDSVEQFREALWQVVHAAPIVTQKLELEVVVPAREHSEMDAEPDDPMPEVETPASLANATIREEVTSTDALSGPLLSPAIAGEGKPPVKIAWQEGSSVLYRKKLLLPSSVETHGKYKRRKRKARKFFPAGLVFLLVCVIGSGLAIGGYQTYDARYQKEVALAQVGIKHLQTALSLMQAWSQKPFDAPSVTPARQEFMTASAAFAQLDTDLQSFSGAGTSIPGNGTRLSAALHVVPVAMKVSQAGVSGCDALNLILSRFHEPFNTSTGLTSADLTVISKNLHQVEADINQAAVQVNALQPGDLQFDSRIGKAVAAFHQYLPSLQTLLHETDQLLPVLPSLLGISTPAYYLIEILDSTQLRPGGGFIEDYGFATLIGGRLSAAHITDANLLDATFTQSGQTLSLPPGYRWFNQVTNSWSLHDSNLDA